MELNRELENPAIWDHPVQAQALERQRSQLQQAVDSVVKLETDLQELKALTSLAHSEADSGVWAGHPALSNPN